jgi:hypothetical protein
MTESKINMPDSVLIGYGMISKIGLNWLYGIVISKI